MARDKKKLRTEIRKWKRIKEMADNQIKKLEELLEKTKVAVRFYTSATPKVKEELSNPQNWKNYIEMNYVNEISAIY